MIWRNSFSKAYNLRRHEGEEAQGKVVEAAESVKEGMRRAYGQMSTLLPRREPGRHYTYKLIRSDLEEEHVGRELPKMPTNVGGIRQQQVNHIAMALGRMHMEKEETGRLAWVESGLFHGVSGIVICVNAVLIGLETDIKTPAWFWVEQFLLTFFCFELVVRLLRHGLHFFRHEDDWIWNFFDLFIVVSGVCDTWMMPLFERLDFFSREAVAGTDGHEGEGAGRMSVFFMLMRMLRLLRIVRLFRLVRMVRPLYELAQGVLEALQGMFWVLIFLVMTLYTVAILCTRVIGHGDLVPEDQASNQDLQDIIVMFASVEDSMFTLFGTMSSWSLLKFVPLFHEMPGLKPVFVIFYVYSAWALLAVMTGVVSENMIAIREQMVKEDEQREEMRKTQVTKLLIELFQNADTDHSGTVSKQEFEVMLRCPELAKKIERNTHLKIKDLEELFDWLDHDGSGTITIDEFMKGFKWVNEPLRAKSLVKLQERLASDLKSLETSVTEVLERRAAEVLKLVAAPLRKVHAITEQMQTLDVHFGVLRAGIKEQGLEMPTPQDLRDVEARLSYKMSLVIRRLDEVECAAARSQSPRGSANSRRGMLG